MDARQLFRFSALTFNTHLIHYDRAWAREVADTVLATAEIVWR